MNITDATLRPVGLGSLAILYGGVDALTWTHIFPSGIHLLRIDHIGLLNEFLIGCRRPLFWIPLNPFCRIALKQLGLLNQVLQHVAELTFVEISFRTFQQDLPDPLDSEPG